MIKKIEIHEELNNIYQTLILIDLDSQSVTRFLNDEITLKKEINTTKEEMEIFLKKYILYWKENMSKDAVIDGNSVKLSFYFDNEIIKYSFTNDYPSNYNEFSKLIKKMVNIYE